MFKATQFVRVGYISLQSWHKIPFSNGQGSRRQELPGVEGCLCDSQPLSNAEMMDSKEMLAIGYSSSQGMCSLCFPAPHKCQGSKVTSLNRELEASGLRPFVSTMLGLAQFLSTGPVSMDHWSSEKQAGQLPWQPDDVMLYSTSWLQVFWDSPHCRLLSAGWHALQQQHCSSSVLMTPSEASAGCICISNER